MRFWSLFWRGLTSFSKDNDDITNNSNYIISSETNHAGQNQTIWKLTIARLVRDEHMGSYKCYAENAMSEEYIIVNLDINSEFNFTKKNISRLKQTSQDQIKNILFNIIVLKILLPYIFLLIIHNVRYSFFKTCVLFPYFSQA